MRTILKQAGRCNLLGGRCSIPIVSSLAFYIVNMLILTQGKLVEAENDILDTDSS